MRLDLLRHGQVEGGRKYRGHGVDDPLSPDGWQQLMRATAHNPGWQQIHASPLKRCAQFAHTLAQQTQLPLHIHPDLREVGFGAWEGKNRTQLEQENPQQLQAFLADPVNNRPKGAEPMEQLVARVGTVLDQLVEQEEHFHGLLLVHAGIIRAALAHCMAIPLQALYRIEIQTACFTTLEYRAGHWHLLGLNRAQL